MANIFSKVFRFFLILSFVAAGFFVGQIGTNILIDATLANAAENAAAKKEGEVAPESGANRDRYEQLELFQKVLHFVETHYVDETNTKELIHGAIKGMLDSLDPHSNFLPEKIFREMKIDTAGKFGGLGIEVGVRDDILTVIAPIEDSPAWEAGIQPNDRITKINGKSTKGMSLTEAVAEMRGNKGSAVGISIYRKGFEKEKDVTLKRREIKLKSVKHELIEPNFGYVRLTTFNETAARDVERAIKDLEKKGKLSGLVFDLRNTPGGLLDQAVAVASLFVDEGAIVSTIGRERERKDVKIAQKGKARKDFPLAVLVNSSTASAAEIVAGALKDHHRAVIMGEQTFGKGSVQSVIELGKDLGLKLTVARFYTPAGNPIQEHGVTPDINLENFDPELLAKAKITKKGIMERDLPGHIKGEPRSKSFSKEELMRLVGDGTENDSGEPGEMKPNRFDPRSDYQVREAVNHLKSFEIFKKIDEQDKKDAKTS